MSAPAHRSLLLVATVAAVAALTAGCASVSDHALRTSLAAIRTPQAGAASIAASPPVPPCGDPTASLRPRGPLPTPGHMPPGSTMRAIQDRGKLVAGVDQNTLLFAYANPFNHDQLVGFEIDLLHQVAKAIFGNPTAIDFKAISSDQRVDVVQRHNVDLVADAMTINCARRKQVAFSTVYYNAGQRVLVPKDSPANGTAELGGKRVCATFGSTSIEQITRTRLATRPDHLIPYGVKLRTDCLVALQEGRTDAISTDDAILFGLQAQDPYTKIVGPRFTPEPYGIAINLGHPDLVRFVNGVLAQMRSNGTLAAIYANWIKPVSHESPAPPAAHYRD